MRGSIICARGYCYNGMHAITEIHRRPGHLNRYRGDGQTLLRKLSRLLSSGVDPGGCQSEHRNLKGRQLMPDASGSRQIHCHDTPRHATQHSGTGRPHRGMSLNSLCSSLPWVESGARSDPAILRARGTFSAKRLTRVPFSCGPWYRSGG